MKLELLLRYLLSIINTGIPFIIIQVMNFQLTLIMFIALRVGL